MSMRLDSIGMKLLATRTPLMQRFLSGAFWSFFGSLVANGSNLILGMIVARLLGKDSFGHYVAVQTTLNAIIAFNWFGIGYTATRYSAELCKRDPVRLGKILALCHRVALVMAILATFVLYFASDWLASHVMNSQDLGKALSIACFATVFSSLDGFQRNVLIGMSELRAFAQGMMFAMLVSSPVMIGLSYLYGVDGAAVGIVITAIVNFLTSNVQMRSALSRFNIRLSIEGCLSESSVILHFLIPGIILGTLPSLTHWIVQSMIANSLGGYAELALFGIAMQWFHVVNFLPGTVARALLPMLTDTVGGEDHQNSKRLLLLGVVVNVVTSLPVAVAGALLSPHISEFYGSQFVNAAPVMVITMAASVFSAAQTPVQNLMAARSDMWMNIKMTGGLMALYVAASHMLVAEGAKGVATALAIAYLLQMCWSFLYAWVWLKRSASA